MTQRQRRANRAAILVGLAATVLVLTAYVLGVLDWLELRTLDYRFRWANSIKQSGDIVCIDIDDGSLELAGRWPWPRHEQAALIAVPIELGAKAILVDLTWIEPQAAALDLPRYTDLDTDVLNYAPIEDDVRLPDLELQAAIAKGGNVYLGFLFKEHDIVHSPRFGGSGGAVAALADKRPDDARSLAEALDTAQRTDLLKRGVRPEDIAESLPAFDLARMVIEIEGELEISPAALAARLKLSSDDVERHFEDCRQLVLRQQIGKRLADEPELATLSVDALFGRIYAGYSDRPLVDDTPLKAAVAAALQETLGYLATTRSRLAGADVLQHAPVDVDRILPVYFLHARAAKRCGTTVFEPDDDGVTRHLPLMIRHGDNVLPQLAFGLACDLVGQRPVEVIPSRGARRASHVALGAVRIQIDERGRALVPWVPQPDWQKQYTASGPDGSRADEMGRVPADALWEIHNLRAHMTRNARNARLMRAQLYTSNLFAKEARATYEKAYVAIEQLRRRSEQARLSARFDNARILREQIARESTALAALERSMAAADTDDWVREQITAVDKQTAAISVINDDLQKRVDQSLTRLRPAFKDRICVIGYTASALADMTPIPTHKRAPGVLAHANLLNGLLTGQTVSWAPRWANLMLAGLLGLLATLLSYSRPPRDTLLLIALVAFLFLALAGWWAFYLWHYWIALVPAMTALALSYFAIATYRYIFVDIERRKLSTALGQYTSREIAQQVADDTELCRRAEMREVTTMFTDLKGFTTISERIGAERTQHVLNLCLGRFTQVMLHHEGMVNKFLGDGIFAFWNPVIYPQADHALRASLTAVDLLAALDDLKREQRAAGGDDVFEELLMRVGVATGNAVVGPCGSEQKFDYTCIGDSVNVAARLESANKFYGTQILINDATRNVLEDAFVCRDLGAVQVKGKRQGVRIYELIGAVDDVPQAVVAHAVEFAKAVAHFQNRRWEAAAAIFGVCIQQRPDDLAAMRYAELCAKYLNNPPDEDWNGSIELMEK